MGQTKIINKFGEMTGWNQVTVNLLGRDLEGITELSYDDTDEKENVPGAGKFAVGRTSGTYEATASITLYMEEVLALQRALPRGKRLQDIKPFDIPVVYENEEGVITTDVIRNAQFKKNSRSLSQGDGTVPVELELIISHIDWDVAAA